MDDKDELLEQIETAVRDAPECQYDRCDIERTMNRIAALIMKARAYGVIRYPVPS